MSVPNPIDRQQLVSLVLDDVRRAQQAEINAVSYSEHIEEHQDIIDEMNENINRMERLIVLLAWYEGTLPKRAR